MLKRCAYCENLLPAEKFVRREDSADGLASRCVGCSYERETKAPAIAGGGRLPVAPFRKWLKSRLPFYQDSIMLLAIATNINERQLRRCLSGETSRVSLDIVDLALTSERSTYLWELGYSEKNFADADRVARVHDVRSSV